MVEGVMRLGVWPVRKNPRTTPAIKPLRARGEWNFTGEPGDTPDPYSPELS